MNLPSITRQSVKLRVIQFFTSLRLRPLRPQALSSSLCFPQDRVWRAEALGLIFELGQRCLQAEAAMQAQAAAQQQQLQAATALALGHLRPTGAATGGSARVDDTLPGFVRASALPSHRTGVAESSEPTPVALLRPVPSAMPLAASPPPVFASRNSLGYADERPASASWLPTLPPAPPQEATPGQPDAVPPAVAQTAAEFIRLLGSVPAAARHKQAPKVAMFVPPRAAPTASPSMVSMSSAGFAAAVSAGDRADALGHAPAAEAASGTRTASIVAPANLSEASPAVCAAMAARPVAPQEARSAPDCKAGASVAAEASARPAVAAGAAAPAPSVQEAKQAPKNDGAAMAVLTEAPTARAPATRPAWWGEAGASTAASEAPTARAATMLPPAATASEQPRPAAQWEAGLASESGAGTMAAAAGDADDDIDIMGTPAPGAFWVSVPGMSEPSSGFAHEIAGDFASDRSVRHSLTADKSP